MVFFGDDLLGFFVLFVFWMAGVSPPILSEGTQRKETFIMLANIWGALKSLFRKLASLIGF